MKIKIIVFLLFFNLISNFGQSKKVTIFKVNSMVLNADTFVGIDGLGYMYFIKNTVFYKQKGQETWQYQNVALGEITKIDIINPLKIVLFYENFNSIVLLDNQLNEIQNLNFSTLSDGIIAHGIGKSAQNSVWIFNTGNQKLGLFNYETKVYMQLNQPLKNNVLFYESDFNYFTWIDEKQMAYSMDVFGKVIEIGLIPVFDSFKMVENRGYLYLKNNVLTFFDFKTNLNYAIEISEKSIKNFTYKDQILTIFTGEQIINYKIQVP